MQPGIQDMEFPKVNHFDLFLFCVRMKFIAGAVIYGAQDKCIVCQLWQSKINGCTCDINCRIASSDTCGMNYEC